ncbi:MAG: cytochrome c [Bacteroidia bacterium]|nr:cytochrome c [Bacteroidia bacterium]MCF8428352.1 cytochrome c [Bacteroidia bacterium]
MNKVLFLFLLVLLGSCSDSELIGMKQISHGAQIYKAQCANCHQDDGSGLAQLIPPLKHSDYLKNHSNELPCLIQNGLKGKITVNGSDYQLAMPAVNGLTKDELADVCLYVLQKFPETPIQLSEAELHSQVDTCFKAK